MAIDPRDKARWEQRQKDEMRDAAENAKPFTSMAEWQAHYLPNSKPEIEELPQLATPSAVVLDERAAISAALDVLYKVSPKSDQSDYVWIEIRKAREGLSALQARAASPQPQAQTERAAFEVYAKTRFNATDMEPWIRHPDEYNSRETQAAWNAWRARAALVAQPVEQTVQVPQFDAKHVSLKERADGKLVLTLLLDGVEGAPRYKVIPVNPGVVRVAQPVEQPVQRNTVSDAVKLACESRGVEFDADSAGATLGRLLRWERENIAQPVEQTRALPTATAVSLIIRDVCEAEPSDPEHADTICIGVEYLRDILERWIERAAARPASGETE